MKEEKIKDYEIIQKRILELQERKGMTQEEKEKENENSVLIQLRHHLARATAIHFNLSSDRKQWRNAIITAVDEEEKLVYLKEFLLGEICLEFKEIDGKSIQEYFTKDQKEKEE